MLRLPRPGLYDHGFAQEAANVKPFLTEPEFGVLEEGSVYCGAWIETQPMGGAMWASRDVRTALNNQLVFTRAQRSDGLWWRGARVRTQSGRP